MKKIITTVAVAFFLTAIVLAILAGNIGVFFGVIAWIIVQVMLYSSQRALKKKGSCKDFALRWPTRLVLWAAMWLLLGAVGTLVSLINQNFGGEPITSDLAGAIFIYPIQIAAGIWLMVAAYLGLRWCEKKYLR